MQSIKACTKNKVFRHVLYALFIISLLTVSCIPQKKFSNRVFTEALKNPEKVEILNLALDSTHSDRSLPEEISRFVNLKELDGWQCAITDIPESIGKLQKLEKVNFRDNDLSGTGNQFTALYLLPRLRYLNMSDNDVYSLSEFLWQDHIEVLDFSYNIIESIPDAIGNSVNLVELYLSHNYIKALPVQMAALQKLKILDLSYNRLQTMPEIFGRYHQLKTLKLDHNFLSSLPASLADLSNLEMLDLSANNLISASAFLTGLQNLKKLNLYGNKIPNDELALIKTQLKNTDVIY